MRLIDADKLPCISTGLCDDYGNMYGAGKIVLAEDIDIAPTITPESLVAHGRWVDNGERDKCGVPKPFSIYCSMCGSSAGAKWHKYCPNCGSKMDLEE